MTIPESAAILPDAGEDLLEVAVTLPLFHTLTYRIPPRLKDQVRVGSLVRVPVGRRQVRGYVLGPATAIPTGELKEISDLLDPLPRFGPEMVPLWRWLAEYYHYPLGEALDQIIPGSRLRSAPRPEIRISLADPAESQTPPRLGPRALEILSSLKEKPEGLSLQELRRRFPGCDPVLKRLIGKGLVRREKKTADPGDREGPPRPPRQTFLPLNPEQESALKEVVAGLQGREFSPFLLHGVTAAGKTEVYLAAAAEALRQGRQVLVLLPEIALTHPVSQEFRRRFGERVAVLHSGLSERQRLQEWRRLAAGRAEVAVGARSAVFAPLPRLGLIVVDEEHDPAYKHEGGLPYQARDVALYRGKLAGAAVLLVSATPAVSTYYRARQGQYRYLYLSHRVTPQPLPEVHLINLKEYRGALRNIISPPLAQAISDTLARGEQVLLFLNRRGFATVMFCLFCGTIFQCRNCSVALTQYQGRRELLCHYCGFTMPVPEHCPVCQSTALKRHGVGTERLESEIRRLWPEARVGRLDRDIAPRSGQAIKVLEDFAAGRLEILIGTQMITKGHHFPGVTLVGVIAADQSLFFPEYHAAERTFQLLTQVAGRAGRGEMPGKVLVQTYAPEHYVFQTVKAQDYQAFFAHEIQSRRQFGYPPFTRLALVRLSGPSQEEVARGAEELAACVRGFISRQGELRERLRVLGPAPAGHVKLKGRFRWQLLLKSLGRPPLAAALGHLRMQWKPPRGARLTLTLDPDPAHLY